MNKIIMILFLSFFIACFHPPNNPNSEFTISKRDTEERIKNATYIKALSCNFNVGQAMFLSELGNDEDPSPDEINKTILYEKRAVNSCLKSILTISCPPFPQNTEQAIELMIFNIFTNRSLNCVFKKMEFFKFQKPLSGSFW